MLNKLVNELSISYDLVERIHHRITGNRETVIRRKEAIIYGVRTENTNIVLPDYLDDCPVCELERGLFEGNSNLEYVTLPKHLIKIHEKAFYNCNNLKAIEFPDELELIDSLAFGNCTSLQKVDLSKKSVLLFDRVFSGCTNLSDIKLSNDQSSLSKYLFEDTGYYNDKSNWKDDVLFIGPYLIAAKDKKGSYEVPEGTKMIADYAFEDNHELRNVTLPESLKDVGFATFSSCKSITITGPTHAFDFEIGLFEHPPRFFDI